MSSKPTPEAEIEQIMDELVLQVLEDGGKTVNGITTSKSEASQALAKLLNRSRISELQDYPLNWADNRNDEVWRKMILSRIAELQTPPATEEAAE